MSDRAAGSAAGNRSKAPCWILTDVAPYREGPAGVHGVLPQARTALAELADLAGLEPRAVPVEELPPSALEQGGVLALFIIGETPFNSEQRAAVESAWRTGRLAILGVHAATDACHTWPAYGPMLGARFDGHPWTRPFVVEVVDRAHPATELLPEPWEWRDEVYLFKDLRPDAHVLLRFGSSDLDLDAPGARIPDHGMPLAWTVDEGGGTFYTALGHFPSAWENPTYLTHLAGGLTWLTARR